MFPSQPRQCPPIYSGQPSASRLIGQKFDEPAPNQSLFLNGDLPKGAAFWYENSNGLAEISVNQGSASRELGVAVGTAIETVS
jgi:hypothetical protein